MFQVTQICSRIKLVDKRIESLECDGDKRKVYDSPVIGTNFSLVYLERIFKYADI